MSELIDLIEKYPQTTQLLMWAIVILIAQISGLFTILRQLGQKPRIEIGKGLGFVLKSRFPEGSLSPPERQEQLPSSVGAIEDEAGDMVGNLLDETVSPDATWFLKEADLPEAKDDADDTVDIIFQVAFCVPIEILNRSSRYVRVRQFWLRFKTKSGDWSQSIPISHYPSRPTFNATYGRAVHLVYYTKFSGESESLGEYTVSPEATPGDRVSGYLLFLFVARDPNNLPAQVDGNFEISVFAKTVLDDVLVDSKRIRRVTDEKKIRTFCENLIERTAMERWNYLTSHASDFLDPIRINLAKSPVLYRIKSYSKLSVFSIVILLLLSKCN